MIEQGAVLADQSNLGRSGTCVDAEEAVTLIIGKQAPPDLVTTVALLKHLVSRLICKQRFHAFYFEIHPDTARKIGNHTVQRKRLFLFGM